MSLSIRVRSKAGVENIRSLDSKSTIAQFQSLLKEKTQIEPAKQKILFGYPPKVLDTNTIDPNETIEKYITNGDSITVEETSGSNTSSSNTTSSSSGVLVGGSGSLSSNSSSGNDGYILRRKTDDDNSCLFSSIAYVLEKKNRKKGPDLRQVIVSAVRSDPSKYNEAYLEKSNEEYCQWILNPKHWGGAIELSILSSFYKVEIGAFDIQTTILYTYGEDQNYSERVYIIYDGLHYDALALCPYENGSENYDKTIFPTKDENTLKKAKEFVQKEHNSGNFTNVADFKLICTQCKEILVGEKGAAMHAAKSKHSKFTEYKG